MSTKTSENLSLNDKSAAMLRRFIDCRCPMRSNVPQANTIIFGLIQMMMSHPDFRNLETEPISVPESTATTFENCVMIFIPGSDSSIGNLRICLLRWLPGSIGEIDISMSQENLEELTTPVQEKIVLPTGQEVLIAEVKDIIRCEKLNNSTIFYLPEQTPKRVGRSMNDLEQLLLEGNFMRIHEDHLVNLNYIHQYIPEENLLVMKDGGMAVVAAQRNKLLAKKMEEYNLL